MEERRYGNEYELVIKARQGDDAALEKLMKKFMPLFQKIYRKMASFYDSSHYDDAMQAGRIGLYKAVFFYREDKNMAFHNFVSICVEREMRSWQKKEITNYYIEEKPILSLDYAVREDDETYLVDMVSRNELDDPHTIAFNRIQLEDIFREYDPQKSIEGKILYMKMEGYSYREIAECTGVGVKDVDNILHKIRKNLMG